VLPEEAVEGRSQVAERERRTGVRNGRLDLSAVPDDGRVRQQPLYVALAEPRDLLRIEPGERGPESLALAQDGQPGEPGLEPLEAQPLVDTPLRGDRPAPLLVVVGQVERIGRLPAASQSATSTRTTPSSTVTG